MRTHTRDRRAHPVRRAGADAGRAAGALEPRALGRIGLPGPARGPSAIPLGARIIAVCDAYDAMVSNRPYRSRMSSGGRARGAAPLRRHAVRPQVVDAFCAVVAERAPAER